MGRKVNSRQTFKGRIYLRNAWFFYLLFSILFSVGLSLYFGSWHPRLSINLKPETLGQIITWVSILALAGMLFGGLNLGKWYAVDEDGIALIRLGFVFQKFYFRELTSIKKLSTEETRELLYQEYAPSLMFRRAPMDNELLDKVPKAFEVGRDLNNLTRYSTVAIIPIGYRTGYQHPTVEDARKTYRFLTKGPFVLLTTKNNKHILISPVEVNAFIDCCHSRLSVRENGA